MFMTFKCFLNVILDAISLLWFANIKIYTCTLLALSLQTRLFWTKLTVWDYFTTNQ